jgi:membrane protease YdiL (CAAX protease family)
MLAQKTAGSIPQAASRPASRHGGLLARRPLASFFVLTFALTWLGWSPWFLSEAGVGLLPYDGGRFDTLFNNLGLFLGPALSAFIVTASVGGSEGVRRLLRRVVLWRVGLRWYAFVLLGLPALVLAATLLVPGASVSLRASAVPPSLLLFVAAFPYVVVLGAALPEEVGWRGFALPRLQRLHGPLVGSIVLGTLWGLWHLPLFLLPGWDTPHGSVLDLVLFVAFAVSMAVVLTWVFNNTHGSVLLAILAHASVNTFSVVLYDLFPVPAVADSPANYVIGMGAAALAVVATTRGRLGYRREEDIDPA